MCVLGYPFHQTKHWLPETTNEGGRPNQSTGYSLLNPRQAPRRYLRNIKQKLFIRITFNKLEGRRGSGKGREQQTFFHFGLLHLPVLGLDYKAATPSASQGAYMNDHTPLQPEAS